MKAIVSRVVFPGESVEFGIPANFIKDSEVAIEPRDNLAWPTPQIVSTSDGKMEVCNDTKFPLKIKKQQVIAEIRSVVTPEKVKLDCKTVTTKTLSESQKILDVQAVQVDPNNIMSSEQKNAFAVVNNTFSSTF